MGEQNTVQEYHRTHCLQAHLNMDKRMVLRLDVQMWLQTSTRIFFMRKNLREESKPIILKEISGYFGHEFQIFNIFSLNLYL